MLQSKGPGILRDLYVNLMMTGPGDRTDIELDPDTNNWIVQRAFGVMFNLVSKETFRLAPFSLAQPLVLKVTLAPPFEKDLKYTFTFGHGTSPVRRLRVAVPVEHLRQAYEQFVGEPDAEGAGHAFVRAAMGLQEQEARGSGAYDSP
jgi:hypothetical protein